MSHEHGGGRGRPTVDAEPGSTTALVRKLRAKRVAEGLCTRCLKNPVDASLPAKDFCPGCYQEHIDYLRARYEERRAKGLCVQCGKPAKEGYLCEPHAAARRKRRQRSGR